MTYSRTYYRRRGEENNATKTVLLVLLTLGVLVFMLTYGIRIAAKLAGFLADLRGSDQPFVSDDITPPAPPYFDSLPEATNSKEIEISGRSESGAKLKVMVNDGTEELIASKDGEFSFRTELLGGTNVIYATAIDNSGNASLESKRYVIVYDNEAPELDITEPSDGTSFTGGQSKNIRLKGTTGEGVDLKVNERIVSVDDEDGSFDYPVTLNEGENLFMFVATDKAGNKTERQLVVNYAP